MRRNIAVAWGIILTGLSFLIGCSVPGREDYTALIAFVRT